MPVSAGPLRDFWLANTHRAGKPPRVAGEVTAADEVFELVAASTAVTLLAEGHATIYSRPGSTCNPVTSLEPAQIAVAWRHGDRRTAIHDFIHLPRRRHQRPTARAPAVAPACATTSPTADSPQHPPPRPTSPAQQQPRPAPQEHPRPAAFVR
jgi:hypothetical protein